MVFKKMFFNFGLKCLSKEIHLLSLMVMCMNSASIGINSFTIGEGKYCDKTKLMIVGNFIKPAWLARPSR